MRTIDSITEKSTFWAFLALLLGTAALAFAPIFIRLTETTASTTTFWRMFLSTPILAFAWILFPNVPKPKKNQALQGLQGLQALKTSWKDYIALVLAGIFFALDLLFWNIALGHTSVANATLLVNCATFFVAFFSWWFFKKPIGFTLLLGILFSFMGGILLIWPHFNSADNSLWGDILSLGAALFYALYLMMIQIARQTFNTLKIMTISGIVTSIAALIMAWIFNETLFVDSLSSWQALLGLALIVQILGQGFITYALAALSATLSSVVLLLQPVISAWIAWWLFDENLVLIQIIGMLIILSGIAYAKLSSGTGTAKLIAADKAS
jgi:drug/metabolite transporter (DMT)-like permease